MSPRSGAGPAAIYAIADVLTLGADNVVGAVTAMADGGIGTIQVRAKDVPDRELWAMAEAISRRLEAWPGELWIDDRVDLARLGGFAGVHLGQRDLPPRAARAQLDERVRIGRSTHDETQLVAAEADDAVDWLALGPIFPTSSKARPDRVVGLDELRRLSRLATKPLVAIGGIDAGNLAEVLAAGADSVAVLSAVCTGNVADNARRLLRTAAGAGG